MSEANFAARVLARACAIAPWEPALRGNEGFGRFPRAKLQVHFASPKPGREGGPEPFLAFGHSPSPTGRGGGLPGPDPAQTGQSLRDVLAAIRRGDFALTQLLDPDGSVGDVPVRWPVYDCHGGYLLLTNNDVGLFATKNNSSEALHGKPLGLDGQLLSSDERPMSFRLVCLAHNRYRVRAVVYSSDTRHWRHLPWVELAERAGPHDAEDEQDKYWLYIGTQGTGLLY
ncbi:hypothetical protein PR202_ga20779 [Eleusine coracana subsp. coracana]|uniref:Pyridoxamine 5'-phosphate oxidase putative domain-containing protein n=1 Tax=Eleusine coracana subsp. coracana TaxID=191504 RepID=A0AAV5CXI8_ELECO|nr:hypothetical protein PR202_ga20779 [Eleusine coracana subsp. coracana]